MPRTRVGVSRPAALTRAIRAAERAEYWQTLRTAQHDEPAALVLRASWRRRAGCRPERFDAFAPKGPPPCWLSRIDWLQQVRAWLHSPDGRLACRTEHVAPDTAYHVAEAFAAAADTPTGQDCRPGLSGHKDSITERARVSLSVVHRTKRVLAAGAYMARLFRGRHMTLLERLRAWEAGEQTRRMASVYALTMPRGRRLVPVDRDTPPRQRSALPRTVTLSTTHSSKTTRPKAGEAASRPPKRGQPGTRRRQKRRHDPRTVRLVHQLRSRLPWLAHGSIARLAPALHRFAIENWTVEEILVAADRQLTSREIAVPTRLRQPEVYFAWLIGPVDEHNPNAGGNAHAAAKQARHLRAEAAAAALPARRAAATAGIAACRAALDDAARRNRQ